MSRQSIKRMMLPGTLSVFSALLLWGCGGGPGSQESPAENPSEPSDQVEKDKVEAPQEPVGTPVALIETIKGTIEIELLPDTAPLTVENFVNLISEGFYKGTTFHRVIPGQLIQGGDPNSRDRDPFNDGQGNSGSYVTAEFSDRPFVKGTVAMARRPGDPNSASCQFFVNLKRMPSWDGQYTVFGRVIAGLEVVEEISKTPTMTKDRRLRQRPTRKMTIKRVRIEYR